MKEKCKNTCTNESNALYLYQRKQLKTNIMNNATITKTVKKVEVEKNYSLGFRRLIALPAKVKKAFDLAANIETNWDGKKALQNQKAFLEGLSQQEFINWLKMA